MSIQSINHRRRVPILGTIRLGIRKEAKSGNTYPSTVEHFVLTDAPEVAKVYGDDPKELDIIFPVDDMEIVLPTWLKLWGTGVKDKDGNIKSGDLKCYGNGPTVDPQTNEIIPGTAHWMAKRDPVTRVVPTRPCLGERCPDWKDSRGRPACKQTMQVLAILPRVSWFGAYIITTSSWMSIRNFHEMIEWVKMMNQGRFSMIPFKMVREEEHLTFVENGQNKHSTQFIMKLKPNERYFQEHGNETQLKLAQSFQSAALQLPSAGEMLARPADEHYPVISEEQAQAEAAEDGQAQAVADRARAAEALVNDPEIAQAFDRLEKAQGKAYPPKTRLIAVKKKVNEADMKGAVLATIEELIRKAASQAPIDVTPRAAAAAPAPTPVAAPPPMEPTGTNGDGIL